jgi:hypothetical protein
MSKPAIILWDQAYNRNGDDKLPRAVVNAIRTYMKNDTLEGWVKRETLASATGLSERQVDRHIAANVKAGWLEITSRGHSGGKSNDYRLTYPETQTDLSMQTDMSGEGRQICPVKADVYVCPTTPTTSPRTSPQEKFEERTTPVGNTDGYDCLQPDPFAGSGIGSSADPWGSVGIDLPPYATSESDTDIYVCLSNGVTDDTLSEEEQAAIIAEYYGDSDDADDDPFGTNHATPEQKLLAAAANGPIRATDCQKIMGTGAETDELVYGLINAGRVIYDREAQLVSLA